MKQSKLFAGVSVAIAMTASSLTPAMAAPVMEPLPAPVSYNTGLEDLSWSPAKETAERHRRYRHRRHRHRRHRVDAGDIIAGVLILGGIAAVADAASKNKRRSRDRDYRYEPNQRYPEQRTQSNELNAAADQCAYAAEERGGRDARVQRIDKVERDGNGWMVEGSISTRSGSEGFKCGVTNGRIDYVQIDGDGSYRDD
ncbi:hypothetical protein [Sphingorhabdus sp. Alg239-R122]|uniref:hypothetical protein n=1 Tax=Sphingorhabdus sp. Alg239-R122 TaxID=2305989 RepID=UPI0013DA72DE|nr:hypothetical protein [Sphingorhabdus sp. Alg239-R122]